MPMTFLRFASLLLLTACGFPRNLEYVPVRSQVLGIDSSYSVHLPPDFREDEQLPLVVFLHGGGDDPASFDRHDLTLRLRAQQERGEVPRAVIVFPQGDNGFWTNWYDGSRNYQDWVTDEVLPAAAARYHTLPCPQHCHVMGVSMGGYGALRLALHRPDLFASVSALSAPIFNTQDMVDFSENGLYAAFVPVHRAFGPTGDRSRIEQEDLYLRWRSPEDVSLRIFMAWGDNDRRQLEDLNKRFRDHLVAAEIPHHAEEYVGNHSWVSWAPVIDRALNHQLNHHDD